MSGPGFLNFDHKSDSLHSSVLDIFTFFLKRIVSVHYSLVCIFRFLRGKLFLFIYLPFLFIYFSIVKNKKISILSVLYLRKQYLFLQKCAGFSYLQLNILFEMKTNSFFFGVTLINL